MIPDVPQSIITIYSWISYLSPIWLLLVAIFWKPLKKIFAKEKTRLTEIENKINRVQEDIEQRKEISKALLHHEIYTSARISVDQGFITEEALENLELLYVPYKKLGGNGTAERLYEQCKSLPNKKENKGETT